MDSYIMLPQEFPKFIFSWIDYTVFFGLLTISVLIGIYFGFYSNQSTTDEYLLAGKKMKTIPVAVSLIACYISGITVLAVPADVYKFGSNYIWCCFGILIACVITAYIFLPVFYEFQFVTIFEYLTIRFDKKIRTIASFLFTLNLIIYNPITVYIPALALSQATGISIYYIIPVVTFICIFYTTIGGLKAVIWTDTLQFFGIIGSTLTVMWMGISSAGGFSSIWNTNVEGQRLDLFNFEFDVTIRDGAWAILIGGTFFWISIIATSQGSFQKFFAVPTITEARKAIAIYGFGVIVLISISVFTGNILYAKYAACDPLLSGKIIRQDQILPYFVMEIGGSIPGLPGIFIGGVFSAALSSLSANLNTMAGTIYQDFILPFMPINTTQKTASKILKILVVVVGIMCILLVLILERMGGILPIVIGFQGIVAGPLVGLFTLGVLFPIANSKGAFCGAITSLVITSWIVGNNQWYGMHGLLPNVQKPISVDGCTSYVNSSTLTTNTASSDLPFVLYRISFWYNACIGTVLVIVVGLLVSWFTSKKSDSVDSKLLSPIIYCMISKNKTPRNGLNQEIRNDNFLFKAETAT